MDDDGCARKKIPGKAKILIGMLLIGGPAGSELKDIPGNDPKPKVDIGIDDESHRHRIRPKVGSPPDPPNLLKPIKPKRPPGFIAKIWPVVKKGGWKAIKKVPILGLLMTGYSLYQVSRDPKSTALDYVGAALF